MIIKTKIAVTHIDVTGIVTGKTKQGIVSMEIGGRYFAVQPDGSETTEVVYQYTDADGNALPDARGGKMTLNNATTLSQAMGNSGATFKEHFDNDIISFAIQEMSVTFGIDPTEIEVI